MEHDHDLVLLQFNYVFVQLLLTTAGNFDRDPEVCAEFLEYEYEYEYDYESEESNISREADLCCPRFKEKVLKLTDLGLKEYVIEYTTNRNPKRKLCAKTCRPLLSTLSCEK